MYRLFDKKNQKTISFENIVESRVRNLYTYNYLKKDPKFLRNKIAKIYFEIYDFFNRLDENFYALHFVGIFEIFLSRIPELKHNNQEIDEFIDILKDIFVNDWIMECKKDFKCIENKIKELNNDDWIHPNFPLSNKIINDAINTLNQFTSNQKVPDSFYPKKQDNTLNENFQKDQKKFKSQIENTFSQVKLYIEDIDFSDCIAKINNKKDKFQKAKKAISDNIDSFNTRVQQTLKLDQENNKTVSPLIKEHYLSFLLDDYTDTIIRENCEIEYFHNFAYAMKTAFRCSLFFEFFSNPAYSDKSLKYKNTKTHKQDSIDNLYSSLNNANEEEKVFYELYIELLNNLNANPSSLAGIIMALELDLSESNGSKIAEEIIPDGSVNKGTFHKNLNCIGKIIYNKKFNDEQFVKMNSTIVDYATHLGPINYDKDIINTFYKAKKYKNMFSVEEQETTSRQTNQDDEHFNNLLITKFPLFALSVKEYLEMNNYEFEDIVYKTYNNLDATSNAYE